MANWTLNGDVTVDGAIAATFPMSPPGFWAAFGHSYLMTTFGTQSQTGRMDAIVRLLFDVEMFDWQNRSVTGSQLFIQGRAQGGYARVLREVPKTARTAPYAADGGAALFCWGINDIGEQGNTTQTLTAFKHALRACISRWRAASVRQNSDSTIAYGAGFATVNNTGEYASGTSTHAASTTASATVTITLPSDYTGQDVAVCVIGAPGTIGGSASFSGTASFATGTVSTSNVMPSSTVSHCPVVVRFQGTSSADASKTVVLTVTSLDAGGAFEFDTWWLEADNPPPVIVCNIARMTNAGYALFPAWSSSQAGADTDVAAFNAGVSSVVAEFDSMVQIADLDSALGKDAYLPNGVTSFFGYDHIHPNEYGAARCAQAVYTAVQKLRPPAGGGLGVTTYMQTSSPVAGGVRRPRMSSALNSALVYTPEFSTWTTLALTSMTGYMWACPVIITEAREWWNYLQIEVSSAPTNAWTFRWGVYDDVGWSGLPQCLVTEPTAGGAFAAGTSTGVKNSPAPPAAGSLNIPFDPGLYWLAFKVESLGASTAPTVRAVAGPNSLIAPWSTSGGNIAYAGWRVTGLATGVLPATWPSGATQQTPAPAVGFKLA